MGLDQYAFVVRAQDVVDDFHIAKDEVFETEKEIAYWRNDRELNNYMQCIFHNKGGKDFNGGHLLLTKKDIDDFEKSLDKSDKIRYNDFIDDAYKYIRRGYAVYYSADW